MLLLRLINWLRGYVICEITGFFLEKFINMVTLKGIIVWGIRKKGKNSFKMCIRIKDFKKLRHPAKSTGIRIRIKKKKGFPFLLHKYRKRKGVFAGFIAFLAIIFVMSGYIWSIDISGNEAISDEKILNVLNESGFKIGIFTLKCNLKETKEDILTKLPELSWIAINIKGSKAVVEVKERIMPPEIISKDTPCNIIAKRDGIIIRADVFQGVSNVEPGYAVAKGSLLVSGVLDSTAVGFRLVHAEANVYGKTKYVLRAECARSYAEKVPTGNVFFRRTLQLFNFDIKLYIKDSIPYTLYDKMDYKQELKVGNDVYLPIVIKTEKFAQLEEITTELSEDEAKKRAEDIINELEKKELSGKDIQARELSFKLKNDVVYAECIYECVEDIGEEALIENE